MNKGVLRPHPVAPAEEVIATVVVRIPVGNIAFDGIPQGYHHLIMRVNAKSADGGTSDDLRAYFNGDVSSSLYDEEDLKHSNTTKTVTQQVNGTGLWFGTIGASSGSSTQRIGGTTIYIPGYNNSLFFKYTMANGFVSLAVGTFNQVAYRYGGCWRNTNPITRIDLRLNSGANFLADSLVSLVGVR